MMRRFVGCNENLLIEFCQFYFLFFKNTLSNKKQRSNTTNPARKLSVESAEYPRINILRDRTAIRISVIPMIEMMVFDAGFFMGLNGNETKEPDCNR